MFDQGNIWTEADNNLFDVLMGSNMGAEICDLIGLFLLNDVRKLSKSECICLYRDDRLKILIMRRIILKILEVTHCG